MLLRDFVDYYQSLRWQSRPRQRSGFMRRISAGVSAFPTSMLSGHDARAQKAGVHVEIYSKRRIYAPRKIFP